MGAWSVRGKKLEKAKNEKLSPPCRSRPRPPPASPDTASEATVSRPSPWRQSSWFRGVGLGGCAASRAVLRKLGVLLFCLRIRVAGVYVRDPMNSETLMILVEYLLRRLLDKLDQTDKMRPEPENAGPKHKPQIMIKPNDELPEAPKD